MVKVTYGILEVFEDGLNFSKLGNLGIFSQVFKIDLIFSISTVAYFFKGVVMLRGGHSNMVPSAAAQFAAGTTPFHEHGQNEAASRLFCGQVPNSKRTLTWTRTCVYNANFPVQAE